MIEALGKEGVEGRNVERRLDGVGKEKEHPFFQIKRECGRVEEGSWLGDWEE